MLTEIDALMEKPLLLTIVIGWGVICGFVVARLDEKFRRAKGRAYFRAKKAASGGGGLAQGKSEATSLNGPLKRAALDSADQLRIIMEAQFQPRPLLNKSERRLLAHLDRNLSEHAPGWRAMGQVSLGEILASDNTDAYFAINSKRVDILIVDADCQPMHAIEFQGKGHHQGTAAARDAIKKEALRRAGIGYIEIKSGHTPADLRDLVRKLAESDNAARSRA